MNLLDELAGKIPAPTMRGTIVRGSMFSGDEAKPTGRRPDMTRREKVIEVLLEGPATVSEICYATALRRDKVVYVLKKLAEVCAAASRTEVTKMPNNLPPLVHSVWEATAPQEER